jgi:anti-sigma B factor antagonist
VTTLTGVVNHGTETKPFAIDCRSLGAGRISVAVRGELDLAHAADLKATLVRELAAGTSVLLDLSAVEFIDSTGLAAIVTALNHSKGPGAQLRLDSNLQPQARRLMELTGVLALLSSDRGPGEASAGAG